MGTQRELTEREEKANERRGGSRGGMRAMIDLKTFKKRNSPLLSNHQSLFTAYPKNIDKELETQMSSGSRLCLQS